MSPDPAPAAKPYREPGRSPVASACEPFRQVIEAAVAGGRDAKTNWRDLVDDYGVKGRDASVKRFVRRHYDDQVD